MINKPFFELGWRVIVTDREKPGKPMFYGTIVRTMWSSPYLGYENADPGGWSYRVSIPDGGSKDFLAEDIELI